MGKIPPKLLIQFCSELYLKLPEILKETPIKERRLLTQKKMVAENEFVKEFCITNGLNLTFDVSQTIPIK